jgi:hypothetical protein
VARRGALVNLYPVFSGFTRVEVTGLWLRNKGFRLMWFWWTFGCEIEAWKLPCWGARDPGPASTAGRSGADLGSSPMAFYVCSKFSWVFPRYITVQYGASSIIIHEWTETTSAILGAATEVVFHQTMISVWVSNTTLHGSSTGILTLIKLIRQIKHPKFNVMISWSVIEVLFKIQGQLLP